MVLRRAGQGKVKTSVSDQEDRNAELGPVSYGRVRMMAKPQRREYERDVHESEGLDRGRLG